MADIHLRIEGRVQGVGFRWFVREKAVSLGVDGWVRNTEDGAVELVARGDDELIEELVRQASAGPAGAFVRRVLPLATPGPVRYPNPFRIES